MSCATRWYGTDLTARVANGHAVVLSSNVLNAKINVRYENGFGLPTLGMPHSDKILALDITGTSASSARELVGPTGDRRSRLRGFHPVSPHDLLEGLTLQPATFRGLGDVSLVAFQ
jgi:hypothetical protein